MLGNVIYSELALMLFIGSIVAWLRHRRGEFEIPQAVIMRYFGPAGAVIMGGLAWLFWSKGIKDNPSASSQLPLFVIILGALIIGYCGILAHELYLLITGRAVKPAPAKRHRTKRRPTSAKPRSR